MCHIDTKLSVALLFCTILALTSAQWGNSDSFTCKLYCENKCVFGRHPVSGQCIEPNIHCDCGSNAALLFVVIVVTVLAVGRIIVSCLCFPLGVSSARIGLPSCAYSQDVIGQSSLARAMNMENEVRIATPSNSFGPGNQDTVPQNSNTDHLETIFDPPPSYADATGVGKE